MAVATFDTLKFANALKAAGVPEKQAEAEAAVLSEALQLNLKDLATKDDLTATKVELKRDIDDVRREIKETDQRLGARLDVMAAENKALRAELKGDMLLLKWMFGASMTAFVGILIRMLLYRSPM